MRQMAQTKMEARRLAVVGTARGAVTRLQVLLLLMVVCCAKLFSLWYSCHVFQAQLRQSQRMQSKTGQKRLARCPEEGACCIHRTATERPTVMFKGQPTSLPPSGRFAACTMSEWTQ